MLSTACRPDAFSLQGRKVTHTWCSTICEPACLCCSVTCVLAFQFCNRYGSPSRLNRCVSLWFFIRNSSFDNCMLQEVWSHMGCVCTSRIPQTGTSLRAHFHEVSMSSLVTLAGCLVQGIAHQLIQMCIDHLKVVQCTQITLHASPQGRPMYQQMGFVEGREMRLDLAPFIP